MATEPERKRKTASQAKCSVEGCGKGIKCGKGVCRECYDEIVGIVKHWKERLEQEKESVAKVEERIVQLYDENEKIVAENAKLLTEKALRDNVLSSNFRFTVYQESPKSPGNPLDAIDRILPASQSRTVLEISDGGVVRCRMYMPEATRLGGLIGLAKCSERLIAEEKPE